LIFSISLIAVFPDRMVSPKLWKGILSVIPVPNIMPDDFFLFLFCFVGVHCGIYKVSYNVSNMSYFNICFWPIHIMNFTDNTYETVT
jgi:hypothetical protein